LTVGKDLLTESGSIFVQIGDENVHLVRCLLEEVFGSENFVAQIYFQATSGRQNEHLDRTGNYLLWFANSYEALKSRPLLLPKDDDENGEYDAGDLQSQGVRSTGSYPVEVDGRVFRPQAGNHWKVTQEGMRRLLLADRIHVSKTVIRFKRFNTDTPFRALRDVWTDTGGGAGRDKVYVVQTNAKIVERCLLMSTEPGDLVLDPTCGAGTTAYVAEQWGRRWITIDTSRVALALARQRLMGARFPWYLLADSTEGRAKESTLSALILPPADVKNDIRHGFVYERARHITLKSIANNPDIKEGMSREEIDAAIRRHAEFELLYDRPCTDTRKVRVSGPFTVESPSPHRSLAFAGSAVDSAGALSRDHSDAESRDDMSFEQTILASLRAAGIQNGRKNERLTFDSVETYAGSYIQAVGHREYAADGAPKRVGVTIGPQYGTVGPSFIKDAAREANRAADLDLLCVLAFAFDPSVLGSGDDYVTSEEGFANVAAERRLGRVPVLLVRMNADLVMGEDLKKTSAGNLFTVFGQPDIGIKDEDGELRVVLHGVDVYDPNTGQIRSNDTHQVALWMIDTNYNEESFFVRHCYFTGGQDPYAKLKRALKDDIDREAWEGLHRTESRPFQRPETGKIAVKVINDYGDEVMRVFDV
jgi:adenine-specific DNA-methyltransferase